MYKILSISRWPNLKESVVISKNNTEITLSLENEGNPLGKITLTIHERGISFCVCSDIKVGILRREGIGKQLLLRGIALAYKHAWSQGFQPTVALAWYILNNEFDDMVDPSREGFLQTKNFMRGMGFDKFQDENVPNYIDVANTIRAILPNVMGIDGWGYWFTPLNKLLPELGLDTKPLEEFKVFRLP